MDPKVDPIHFLFYVWKRTFFLLNCLFDVYLMHIALKTTQIIHICITLIV